MPGIRLAEPLPALMTLSRFDDDLRPIANDGLLMEAVLKLVARRLTDGS